MIIGPPASAACLPNLQQVTRIYELLMKMEQKITANKTFADLKTHIRTKHYALC